MAAVYGSRKMNSLRTMTLEDCHGLFLVVLLRGTERREAHLVHLNRALQPSSIFLTKNILQRKSELVMYIVRKYIVLNQI